MEKTCGTCHNYDISKLPTSIGEPTKLQGVCRAKPPVIVNSNHIMGTFPGVMINDWCGAWEGEM